MNDLDGYIYIELFKTAIKDINNEFCNLEMQDLSMKYSIQRAMDLVRDLGRDE